MSPLHTQAQTPSAAAPVPEVFDPQARLAALLDRVQGVPAARCAVVHPCDADSLQGALQSANAGLIVPVLIGPLARIQKAAEDARVSLAGLECIDVPHSHAAAERAAQMAAQGEVEMIMKGSLHTDELLRAVLAEPRLRTGRRLSHVFRFELPRYNKPIVVTDAAINIAPTLLHKVDIVQNAIDFLHIMGIAQPKVAVLSAIETVTPSMVSTLDAAALCKMADRGQILGGVLDGPLAFDNAVSLQAAHIKHIASPVAGQADVLVVPDLEAGNMLAKQFEYFAGAMTAGLVLGARAPIVLTSRADTVRTRVASSVLALRVAAHARAHVLYRAPKLG